MKVRGTDPHHGNGADVVCHPGLGMKVMHAWNDQQIRRLAQKHFCQPGPIFWPRVITSGKAALSRLRALLTWRLPNWASPTSRSLMSLRKLGKVGGTKTIRANIALTSHENTVSQDDIREIRC